MNTPSGLRGTGETLVLTRDCGCKGQVLEKVGAHMCMRLCPGAPYLVGRARKMEARISVDDFCQVDLAIIPMRS